MTISSSTTLVNGGSKSDFVSPEQYGLPKCSAKQKLSPLDMNMPRLYGTRWIFCFPSPAESSGIQVYNHLREGLAYTIAEFPWIAGNVGPEEGEDPGLGRIQVVDGVGGVEFRFRDLTNSLPAYQELKSANFPLAKLTTVDLSPVGPMPRPPNPVMVAQANFVTGGLLLTVAIHHSVCDGLGLNVVIGKWATYTAMVASGNIPNVQYDNPSNDRSSLILADSSMNVTDFPEYILMPSPRTSANGLDIHSMVNIPFQLPPMTSHLFFFSPESLLALKSSVASYSTNDALIAFLWKHMTLARNPSNSPDSDPNDEDKASAMLVATNVRDRTSPPLPPDYPGNASMAIITRQLSASRLRAEDGLSKAAATIRSSINAFNSPNRVLNVIKLLGSRSDPSDFKFAYNAFLGPDISATSWSKFDIYNHDWGFLGKPEAFRIPGDGSDGTIMVFPQVKNGGLEVAVGLEDGAMQRLLTSEEFLKTAVLSG